MLKINLNDLTVLSKEEIMNSGWMCQRDFYLFILSLFSSLEAMNDTIEGIRYRAHCMPLMNKSNEEMYKKYHYSKNDFLKTAENYKLIAENYDMIKQTYPEFEDFIISISTVKKR